jgi:hypothetical protein
MSPYLYIIFSYVLQQLIKLAFEEEQIMHPVKDDIPPVVLQYTADILIIAGASSTSASHMCQTLFFFALAILLQIN